MTHRVRITGTFLAVLSAGLALGPFAVAMPAGEVLTTQPIRPAAGLHTFRLTVAGLARQYVVYVPRGYDGGRAVPVVMMFHGGGGKASGAMSETQWCPKADREGFLAVFGEGTRPDPNQPASLATNPQTWNDGSARANVGAAARGVDDVQYVRRVVEDLRKRFHVDDRRVYATGFSNGASMAFRLGREMSRTFAAIAPVAGADWSSGRTIDRAIPMLYITGKADPLNPFDGGPVRIGLRTFGQKQPVIDLVREWVRLLGLENKPRVLKDADGVRAVVYGPGRGGAEVVFYAVDEMGHHWAGGPNSRLPERLVGKSSNRINATDVIWAFFRDHPMPAGERPADK